MICRLHEQFRCIFSNIAKDRSNGISGNMWFLQEASQWVGKKGCTKWKLQHGAFIQGYFKGLCWVFFSSLSVSTISVNIRVVKFDTSMFPVIENDAVTADGLS